MDAPIIRRRVNVSTTTKGIQHAEATFEITGDNVDPETFRFLSMEFFDWVDKVWPPPVEGAPVGTKK